MPSRSAEHARRATAYVGIDLGTSGVKVLVVDGDGRALGRGHRAYDLHRPETGAAEADPADWWAATCAAVREATVRASGCQVRGVGLSGQMHGLVLATGNGEPVRAALTWADTRASAHLEAWRALSDRQRARLGNPLVPGMTGPLLSWLVAREPQAVARATWALSAKDWLRLRMTGEAATDPSDASATLLWDLPGDRWAGDVLDALGLPRRLLPRVLPSGAAAGSLTASAADALGLPPGIPVATGAADTAAGLLATRPGPDRLQLTLGTGAQLVHDGARPGTDPRPVTHTYRTARPQGWYAMAAVQNFGLALDWVRRSLAADWAAVYAALDTTDDPRGLPIFVPYLTGERTPVLSEMVRGGWTGLDLGHAREDLLRSALAGVVCAVRHAREALPSAPTGTIWLTGGGARPPALRQLVADLLGTPIVPLLTDDASARGAALLAADAAGDGIRLGEARHGRTVQPQCTARWEGFYRAYRSAAENLAQQVDPCRALP